MRQRCPIGDVAFSGRARLVAARAQTECFRVGVFELPGDLFDNFGFPLGTKTLQRRFRRT
jgi:hypothetical protein